MAAYRRLTVKNRDQLLTLGNPVWATFLGRCSSVSEGTRRRHLRNNFGSRGLAGLLTSTKGGSKPKYFGALHSLPSPLLPFPFLSLPFPLPTLPLPSPQK